ncbi:uncharacterized protein LOC143040590 isoform X1 [Oratosquilla oratoria]|uniref:uncharacterized protein LOC143040590 isoform X1 n=1 Tax=Oratosquilla oratoria TaxID=337810 RepID=UPI003F766B38
MVLVLQGAADSAAVMFPGAANRPTPHHSVMAAQQSHSSYFPYYPQQPHHHHHHQYAPPDLNCNLQPFATGQFVEGGGWPNAAMYAMGPPVPHHHHHHHAVAAAAAATHPPPPPCQQRTPPGYEDWGVPPPPPLHAAAPPGSPLPQSLPTSSSSSSSSSGPQPPPLTPSPCGQGQPPVAAPGAGSPPYGQPGFYKPTVGQHEYGDAGHASPESALHQEVSAGGETAASPPAMPQVARPQQVRSPYEWMKPSYQSQANHSDLDLDMGVIPIREDCGGSFGITMGKTRTKDKYRVVYSDHQRLELEKEFHYSRYITIRRKAELATMLGLSERQVKIWFQNRRAKERKQMKKRDELLQKEKLESVASQFHPHTPMPPMPPMSLAQPHPQHHPVQQHHPPPQQHQQPLPQQQPPQLTPKQELLMDIKPPVGLAGLE